MKMHCQHARKNISLAMDDRLGASALRSLREHLQDCPVCRAWQQEQAQLAALLQAVPELTPAPGFCGAVLDRLDRPAVRRSPFALSPLLFHPTLFRAAMLLLLVLSGALGFFLGDRLESPPAQAGAAAFSQAMNLDAFADLPADSFGAVYDRLLQGKIQ